MVLGRSLCETRRFASIEKTFWNFYYQQRCAHIHTLRTLRTHTVRRGVAAAQCVIISSLMLYVSWSRKLSAFCWGFLIFCSFWARMFKVPNSRLTMSLMCGKKLSVNKQTCELRLCAACEACTMSFFLGGVFNRLKKSCSRQIKICKFS